MNQVNCAQGILKRYRLYSKGKVNQPRTGFGWQVRDLVGRKLGRVRCWRVNVACIARAQAKAEVRKARASLTFSGRDGILINGQAQTRWSRDAVGQSLANGLTAQFVSSSTWATTWRIWATLIGLFRKRHTARSSALASAPGWG
jgi:hypothetical protein